MRASAPSSVKPFKLVQRWGTPGAVRLVSAISGMSVVPSSAAITAVAAPLWMQCAQGYSGCLELGGRVAVDVAIADRGDRPPELVVILGVEHRDRGVGQGYRDERHEP